MSAQTRPGDAAAAVDWALFFASHGMRILPVRARSKLPAITDWPSRATTDPEQITTWFDTWPDANYGLCTSGLVVVDIDPAHGGSHWLEDNEALLGDTWRFKTGSGGWHLIYTAPADQQVGNRAGVAPGVDIRGINGQIIGPGSIHPTGGIYTCETGPEDCDIAAAPACVMDLINGAAQPTATNDDTIIDPFLAYGRAHHGSAPDDPATALQQACEAISNAPIGEQEQTLNNNALRLARRVADGTLRLDDVVDRLTTAGLGMSNEAGKSPWSRPDITTKIMRAVADVMAVPVPVAVPAGGQINTAAPKLPDISKACTSRWIGVTPEPLRFTVDGWVPEGAVTLLVASGGAGKTLLMQTTALCIPTGTLFLGRTTVTGAAACVFAEDPEEVLQYRHARICEAYEIDPDTLIDKVFAQSYFGLPALLWRKGRPTPFMAELERQLSQIFELRFLALDNNALLYGGNEVDRMEVTAFMNALNGMAARLKIGIVLSTHESKSKDGTTLRAASGSTAWINAARSVLRLEAGDQPDQATLTLIKANHAAPGEIIELQWQDAVLVARHAPHGQEALARLKDLDRLIFTLVKDAWGTGTVLSENPQQGERYLVRKVREETKGRFSAKEVKQQMSDHLRLGRLELRHHPRSRRMGLKVVERCEDAADTVCEDAEG